MNIQTKSALIIIITLLIGILVGVLGRGLIPPHHPNLQPDRINPQSFIRHFDHVMDIKGEKKDTVRAILEYHFELFKALNVKHRLEMDSLLEVLYLDLVPHLNDEELQRMVTDRERMRNRPKNGPDMGPPGRPLPPPGNQPRPGDSPPPPPPGQNDP